MLLLLLLLPLAAALVMIVVPSGPWPRRLALVTPGLQLLLAVRMVLQPASDLRLAWLPQIGLDFHLGQDGLSLPLIGLTALLTLMAVAATSPEVPRQRLFFGLVLATNLGLQGALLARNGLLFVIAFELILIPTTLLIAIWGHERSREAAIRYLLYGGVSGVSLLAGVLALGLLNANGFSLAYDDMGTALLPQGSRGWILALLILAFGLKLPVVPLHGWQPLAYSESSSPVAMLLAGAVSKLGAYGLLRFGVGFMGDTWEAWAPLIAVAGTASAVYGALNAIAQTDMRRLVAYSSLGHMGLLLLAMAAATPLSLQGAVAQVLAHGLISALLFCLVGLIEAKTGTTEIPELSGLLNPLRGLPFTLGMFLLALMAAAGLPGMVGFVAELVVFQGSWSVFPLPTLGCLFASGLTAVYAVRLFNRVGFGKLDNAKAFYPATTWPERLPALALSLLVLVGGLWPPLTLGWSESVTTPLAQHRPLIASLPAPSTLQELPS
ncbi:NADH-quinone oxidoreductase subunit M [Synechococcus sp. CBW1107]|uniref:NADH-quinone oxidoreductase subunit M n=1 Tax=Synechococcus sp. CBW1107 TaxID=2789857 RepID=UPI0018CD9EDC|nr:NADH-quinone oxidoreductase subunit M [Synechococcus sp. CBW1107]QPN56445.1 NADH-quinone oxidoreductase subunit M [Synechococcus sp. CBW1107]